MNKLNTRMSRRATALAIALGSALLCAGALAQAQSAPYPSKPIRIVVGYSAGGAVDTIARSLGQAMSASPVTIR